MSGINVHHDLRPRFGPARDQLGRETCLAFAMSDVHAAARGVRWNPLCCEYLFYYAKQRDGMAPSEGTTIAAIQAALEHDGQPLEPAWPYQAALPDDLSTWRPPPGIGLVFRRRATTANHAFSEVWDRVAADRPILIGMTISKAFYQVDEDGIVDSDEPEEHHIRHAVIAVATGERGQSRLLLVRNSWGETWGISGYAWLSERYAEPRIFVALTAN